MESVLINEFQKETGEFVMKEKKTANIEIKKINRSNIYKALRKTDNLSRQDLVVQLRLCLPTVTQNLLELQEEGLIQEAGSMGHTGGRPAKTYSVVANARVAIGMDITKNHITVVAVDLQGNIIVQKRIRYKFERTDTYYKKLGDLVQGIVSDGDLDPDKILGVGIGVPGLITQDGQNVFYGEILNFTGATCQEFSKYIPYPTSLCNDAKAAGFAETWANENLKDFFYIMLSNNIGGAIILNRQLYPGTNIRGGEIGHITIIPDGDPCYCGQKGCVDTYCAATVLSSTTDGNLGAFFQKLEEKDPKSCKLWNTYLYHLSLAVNNLNMLFDCPIILGGYVGSYFDKYIDDLKEMVAARNTFDHNADYLKVCRYKTEAIAAGAALNFIEPFLLSI